MRPDVFSWLKRRMFHQSLKPKRLGQPSAVQQKMIDELRSRTRQLPEPTAISESPADIAWLEYRKQIRQSILQDDPRNFINWDVMRKSMVFTPQIAELKHLRRLPDWNRWKDAIVESPAGNPRPYKAFKLSSGNLIHHAYSLSLLMQTTKCPIEDISEIVEFGGGYGSMCRLVHQLGFKGRYIIFDLPELCELQKYFLSSVGIPSRINSGVLVRDGVILLSELQALSIQLSNQTYNCAFIATWSISEADEKLRSQIFDLVASATYYLIAYQENFRGIDNLEYFSRFVKSKNQYEWFHFENLLIPGNRYLIGKKITSNSHDMVDRLS